MPRQPRFELRAREGRAALVRSTGRGDAERCPEALGLSADVIEALHEWAGMVGTLEPVDASSDSAEVLAGRGRQLAVRVAAETGGQVAYHDPRTGTLTRVGARGAADRELADDESGTSGSASASSASRRPRPTPRRGPKFPAPKFSVPKFPAPKFRARASANPSLRHKAPHAQVPGKPAPGVPAPETPWGTGLTVAAIIAAIVVVALVVVSLGLAEVNLLLAIIVNLAVAAGMAPSIWIGRRVLVWRWVALGAASGIALSWVALLLSVLG